MTLWGSDAEEFNGEKQPVVALKAATVKEFDGVKSVAASFASTILINPDIPEAHQLRSWYDNEGSAMDLKNVSARTGGPAGDGKYCGLVRNLVAGGTETDFSAPE